MMSKKQILLFLAILSSLLIPSDIYSQHDGHCRDKMEKISASASHGDHQFSESTGNSGTGDNIDVLYHKIYWRINPDSSVKYIKGSVQTNFKTIVSNVSTISFDLRSVLVIDSIIFRGAKLPAGNIVRSGNIVSLSLGVNLSINFIDSFTVYYQGIPPAASGAAQGYQRSSNTGAGNFITTLSESYEDRDWWPCKADMQDKIDSMDITVNVPWGSPGVADTFWVACNGKMVDSVIAGGSRSFVFKTRYPIASYLVFVSVARYNRYYRSVNLNGTTIPVAYNLFRGKTAPTYTSILSAMDNMNPLLLAFSNKYGDYPFKLEKHGYYDGLLGAAGMEHQTFSGMGTGFLTNTGVLTHELAHQWFGDNVTFGTWNELWLAEGFATYSEALAGELLPSLGVNPFTVRSSIKSAALGITTVSTWIPNSNTGTSQLIWSTSYGSAVYDRGGMIVSMLRAISGDAKFYEALTNYQTVLRGKSATTDSLRNFFNRALGRDISPFFNDYVGGSGAAATPVGGIGNPQNTVNWGSPSANKLIIQMAPQTRTPGSNVSYFRGPVVLHIKGATAAQDTTLTLFDWGSGNLSYAGNGLSLPVAGNRLSFDLSFTPVTVVYDDSARTMSTGSTVNVPGLNNYVWLGTVNSDWNTAGNWLGGAVPPNGADITIATSGSNQPVLANNVTTGPLNILAGNTIIINGFTLTLNHALKGQGTLTGSSLSSIIVADAAGQINMNQTNSVTRSLNQLVLNSGCSATIGTGIVEVFGGLILPPSAKLTVLTSNLIVH